MDERFMSLLPSVLVLGGIVGATFLFLKFILPILIGNERYKNHELLKVWMKENKRNKWKAVIFATVPFTCIFSPALEEIVFRAPLLFLFSVISGYAWLGIIISSILFALAHYSEKTTEVFLRGIEFAEEVWTKEPNNNAHINGSDRERRKKLFRRGRAIGSFGFGILVGYLGIKYQSLYLCAVIHAAWNLLTPFVLPLLVVIFFFIFLGIMALRDIFEKKRFYARFEKRLR
jgi:membrane protease YdiL (CAAX protease family)